MNRGSRAGTVALLAVLAFPVTATQSAQELSWDRLGEGLAVAVWDPVSVCQDVPPLLFVQVDPERFRFSIHHYQDEGFQTPVTIQEWQRRTGAHLLFNAGLFREDYSYLGLLYKDGRALGTKRHPLWQGLFVAEPVESGARRARVLDLAFDNFPEDKPSYLEAAQSLMLLDRTGRARVNQSGKRAHQTVVAEDGSGHILLIKSTSVVSLYGLADCLRGHLPLVRQAMAMDGGSSSDIYLVGAGSSSRSELKSYDRWSPILSGNATAHIPLPAVVALRPR